MVVVELFAERALCFIIIRWARLDPTGEVGIGGLDQRRFSKLILKRFAVSKRFSKGQKGINLAFNSFFHRPFSSKYIMVPGGGPKGVV